MAFGGKRALVCMKHVGMNVCADAFVNSAMTGANGGLVVVAADDPSMHSSQNDQDSRFYAKFAMIPRFEPASQQEAYEMIGEAFDFSEKYQIPVLMRVTTRMAHSRAVVEIGEPRQQNTLHYPERPRQWILMPGNSRVRYKTLIEENKLFEQEAEHSRHNRYIDGPDKSMGIIACGLAYNYIMENFPEGCPFPVLKISQYPLPTALVQRMASECRSLLIVEEGQPLVEEMIRGLLGTPIPVKGRLSGELPRTGELTPDNVRGARGLPRRESEAASQLTMPRPPALCQGCGHRDESQYLELMLFHGFHSDFSALRAALRPFSPTPDGGSRASIRTGGRARIRAPGSTDGERSAARCESRGRRRRVCRCRSGATYIGLRSFV